MHVSYIPVSYVYICTKIQTFSRLAKSHANPSIVVAGLGVLPLQCDSFMLHVGML